MVDGAASDVSSHLLTFCGASYKEKRPQPGSPWWRSAPAVWNQTYTQTIEGRHYHSPITELSLPYRSVLLSPGGSGQRERFQISRFEDRCQSLSYLSDLLPSLTCQSDPNKSSQARRENEGVRWKKNTDPNNLSLNISHSVSVSRKASISQTDRLIVKRSLRMCSFFICSSLQFSSSFSTRPITRGRFIVSYWFVSTLVVLERVFEFNLV